MNYVYAVLVKFVFKSKVRGEMICVQLRKKRAQTFWDCLLGKEKKNNVEKYVCV